MKKFTFALSIFMIAATALSADKLVIKGSDTLGAKLVPQLAEQFKSENPGVTFEIAAEGSSTGIAAIIDGSADIGMSSRDARDKEISRAKVDGVDITAITVAYDGIAVIVNENNPIDELTKEDVEKLFTGDVADWSAIGGIPGEVSAYTRNTSSGTYKVFQQLAMNKRDYGTSTQKMAGNEQIASEVAKNPNGIGYVGLAYIETPGVKVVAVDGVKPSKKTINDKSYPYARPLYYYVDGQPEKEIVQKFIDFTLGDAGQAIVESVHFIPIK